MPTLNGHPSTYITQVPASASSAATGAIGVGGPTTAPAMAAGSSVIDGTPVRVVAYALAAAAGLMLLRTAGFKFNVGVAA